MKEKKLMEQILKEYEEYKASLNIFRTKLVYLISDLLKVSPINVHQIDSRTKNSESLTRKIDKKDNKYKSSKHPF